MIVRLLFFFFIQADAKLDLLRSESNSSRIELQAAADDLLDALTSINISLTTKVVCTQSSDLSIRIW